MTSFRVDADEVRAFGEALCALAEEVAASGNGSIDRWALGPGASGAAFEELISGWRLQRLRLAEALDQLGQGARIAGGLYVDTETAIGGRLIVGGDR